MICPTCRGRQFVSLGGADEDEGAGHQPCPDCIGGIASCCDAAGSYSEAYLAAKKRHHPFQPTPRG